ncbi:MAG: hypothetical protein QUS11_02085 [Candidatus Fermentibacter sp.]|nr:hypothetical protein [Candidatus Fermentibacter sp.]
MDACILINYLRLGRLDILVKSASLRPVVTRSVLDEITDKSQREELKDSISAGRIELIDPDPSALDMFIAAIESGLGRGEASCIAFSIATGILLGCDEKARCFRRLTEAAGLSGRIVTTRDLVVMAILEGRLCIDDANILLGELRTRFRFNVPDIRQCEIKGSLTIGSK